MSYLHWPKIAINIDIRERMDVKDNLIVPERISVER